MISRSDKICYRILADSGLIPHPRLEELRQQASASKIALGEWIVRQGDLNEDQLLKAYVEHTDGTTVDLRSIPVDRSLLEKIPVKFVWYYKIFPLSLKDRRLRIAVSQPLDVNTLDEIRFGLGYEIETVFAKGRDVEDMLKEHYGLGAETVDKILTRTPASEKAQTSSAIEAEEDIEKMAEDASVIQLVNQILLDAYRKRASDIHVEPYRGKVRVRYRIDGALQETRVPPEMNRFMLAILSRIKIMANLNIVEKRLPQDGKARVKTQDQVLNLRVSSLPTPHGESLVIRILPTKMILSPEELGLEPENLKIFRDLISRPHGIIFVTGPTGSGKSTTLYAALNTLSTTERKVITLEDPIEYEMSDMIQMQVLPDIGLTFSRGLRSALRHDPDVMMVGEVRDFETADIAIRVALTGHLILSTLHTNDAASGVTRLLDIGVEPYLVASSVLAFMAQRLVRVICPGCKKEIADVPDRIRRMISQDLGIQPSEVRVWKGEGCEQCGRSGYSGRMAIHEILVVNEEIRQLILDAKPADRIKMAAKRMGMKTLREDGWQKVLRGWTTPDEVMQSTPAEELAEPVIAAGEIKNSPAPAEKRAAKREPMLSESAYLERRKYERVSIPLDVYFRPIEVENFQEAGQPQFEIWKGEGQSANISAGGLAFRTREKLNPGDVIEVRMKLTDGRNPLECIGRVLRISGNRAAADRGIYEAAVSFLAIHSVDRLRIEKFCRETAEKAT